MMYTKKLSNSPNALMIKKEGTRPPLKNIVNMFTQ